MNFCARLLITVARLFVCVLTAFLAVHFLGSHIIYTVEFWGYFGIAVIISVAPVVPDQD